MSGEERLVKVAFAQNQAEAELIAGLLREHEVPTLIMREPGFDVPDYLAAGARQVLVAEDQAERAREVLANLPGDAMPGE